MKRLFLIFLASAFTALSLGAAEKVVAGPKGGRLFQQEDKQIEFFVEKDRTVTIAVYDKDLKAVDPGNLAISAIAEAKEARARLEFTKKDKTLVSKTPLPAGNGYTVVLQVRRGPDSKPKNLRVILDTQTCGGCQRAEYACTCHE